MGSRGATGELELVPIATSVPSVGVLYRAEQVPMVRRLTLMGSPAPLAEQIAHRAFRRVARDWEVLADPLNEVRRLAVAELLSRYHPAGQAPTLSPPREGAPAAWAAVAAELDPLSPEDRVARVLHVYDGLDDAAVDVLLPAQRRARRPGAPPVDLPMATLFAEAVADVVPVSRLTSVLGILPDGEDDDLGRAGDGSRRLTLTPRAKRWVGGVAAAFVVLALLSRTVGNDLPTTATRRQEVVAGLGANPGVVLAATQGAAQSSCPAADPVIGPGGTALPEEGETDPARVARVLATDRRALVALHRGGRDARIVDRAGRVRRTGPGGAGRVRNIDGGDDVQIQVVIDSAADCPTSPESWKGVPLVFTTRAAASAQPDVVTAGEFANGVPWEVRDRPGHGLCATLGDDAAPCGTEAGEAELLPVRVLDGGAGRRLAYGYLPAGAASARFERPDGVLGPAAVPVEGGTYFALATGPDDEVERIRFFDRNGAAVAALAYPTE